MKATTILMLGAATVAAAADYPEARISNGVLQATLQLPDAAKGYYRGSRFDWSGAISSLQFKGHEYFGKWFSGFDPKNHDNIMGPVEEFLTNGMGVGYDEAKVGESFVKLGVGAVRRYAAGPFEQFHTYDIVDNGKWSVRQGADFVEFTQQLGDVNGYSYLYKKTVRLVKGKAEMVLEHSLKNTGRKVIASSVYEHNFYMLDQQPAGPEYGVKFAFPAHAQSDLKDLAETRGKDLVYLKELQDKQSVYTLIDGFGKTAMDYQITVDNRKAGIGVKQSSDRPMSKLAFWSIRSTVCPEAFIDFSVAPGKETTWKIRYEFYTLPSAK